MYTLTNMHELQLPKEIEGIVTIGAKQDKLKSGALRHLPGCYSKLEWAHKNKWKIQVLTHDDISEINKDVMDIDQASDEIIAEVKELKYGKICASYKTWKIISLNGDVDKCICVQKRT